MNRGKIVSTYAGLYTEWRGPGLPLRHPSTHPSCSDETESTRGWPTTHTGQLLSLTLSAVVQAYPCDIPPLIPRVVMGLSQHVDDPQPIQVSSSLLHWVPWSRPTPTTSLPSFHGSSWGWVNTWTTHNQYRYVDSYTECSGPGLSLRHTPHPPGRHGPESTRGWPTAHPG